MPRPKLTRTATTRAVAVPHDQFPSLAPAPRADGAQLRNERTTCTLLRADGSATILRTRQLPLDGTSGFVAGRFLPDGRIAITTGDAIELVDDEGRALGRVDAPAKCALYLVHSILDGRVLVGQAVGALFFAGRRGDTLFALGKLAVPREANVVPTNDAIFYARDLSRPSDTWWRIDGVEDLLSWASANLSK
jgi:hypothetical protein